MIAPVHIGIEHPSLLLLFGVGLLAFVAGLAVNLYSSSEDSSARTDSVSSDEEL